jgi:6-phosphofructokinase 1
MCTRLNNHRKAGRNLNIVIVAEGAIDKNGNSITSQYVKDVKKQKF